MKNILVLFFFLSGLTLTYGQNNSHIVTETFEVEGVCNMCKKRIEKAALVKGVKFAEWDKETSLLKVIYNNQKVSSENIHNSVAEAGHDTKQSAASDECYAKLPHCCAYRDGTEKH